MVKRCMGTYVSAIYVVGCGVVNTTYVGEYALVTNVVDVEGANDANNVANELFVTSINLFIDPGSHNPPYISVSN